MIHFITINDASTEQFMFYKRTTQYIPKLTQNSRIQVKCQ